MEGRESENRALIEELKRHNDEAFKLVDLTRGDEDHVQVALVPKGKELVGIKHLLDQYRERPERKKGTTTLLTLEAFCAFVNRHKQYESIVFCDVTSPTKPKLIAVFNASGRNREKPAEGEGEDAGTDAGAYLTTGAPDWEDHRAVYEFPVSDEWRIWTEKLRSELDQAAFAEFLEDRITDVLDPIVAGKIAGEFAQSLATQLATPTRLLSLSRGLAVTVESKVTNVVNLQSGEAQMVFTEAHADAEGKPLSIPGAFAIGIPVFRCGVGYTIPVRLRYRVRGGKALWQLAAQRIDVVFEDAVTSAMKQVEEKTGLPLFRGAP